MAMSCPVLLRFLYDDAGGLHSPLVQDEVEYFEMVALLPPLLFCLTYQPLITANSSEHSYND